VTIYIASKTYHAPLWRDLRTQGIPIISTWIDEAGDEESSSFEDLWRRCIDEASSAQFTIVYRASGDVLKGALIEVGAALASGRQVIAVGCEGFTFTHHKQVQHAASMQEALKICEGEKL
jgi:hypothetical protein